MKMKTHHVKYFMLLLLIFKHATTLQAFISNSGKEGRLSSVEYPGMTLFEYTRGAASQVLSSSEINSIPVDPNVAAKFKLLTCSSTSCTAKRRAMNLNEYATFSAFWEQIQNKAPTVQIEECPCLGSCKKAPCVAVEHDDYDGTVALEGMDPSEFTARVFHRIVDVDDVDRVWSCIENAIHWMVEEEQKQGISFTK